MGKIDFAFKPAVRVFDCNMSIGRRHDTAVSVDTAEGTIDAMQKAGVDRALVHSRHAVYWDSEEGNDLLMESVRNHKSLYPQFVASPFENLDAFALKVLDEGVRSVRMVPTVYRFPFRDWAIKNWLDWMTSEQISLWLPVRFNLQGTQNSMTVGSLDPTEVHETLTCHPDLTAVLCDVNYMDLPWVIMLLKNTPNLCLEMSGVVNTDGIKIALDAIGEQRILFGSGFPDRAIPPQIYHIHRYGLDESTMKRICSENLERLLGLDKT